MGFLIVILKNKYATPTPMGYSDLNIILSVPLPEDSEHEGVGFLCEVQVRSGGGKVA